MFWGNTLHKRYWLWLGVFVFVFVLHGIIFLWYTSHQNAGVRIPSAAQIRSYRSALTAHRKDTLVKLGTMNDRDIRMHGKTSFVALTRAVALTVTTPDVPPYTYDERLINFLINEDISATIMVSSGWMREHTDIVEQLANVPLFRLHLNGETYKELKEETIFNGTHITEYYQDVFHAFSEDMIFLYSITGRKAQFVYCSEEGILLPWYTFFRRVGVIPVTKPIYDQTHEDRIDLNVRYVHPGDIVRLALIPSDAEEIRHITRSLLELKRRNFSFVFIEESWLK